MSAPFPRRRSLRLRGYDYTRPGWYFVTFNYEVIVRDATALANIRAYIRNNPARADMLRFGEPQFMVGNRALLARPLTAFLASRGWLSGQARMGDGQPRGAARTIMSGFLSEMERAVFEQGLADGTPMVEVLARGVPEASPARVQRAIDGGLLLIITPFPPEDTKFSSAKAAWCNQYVLDVASEIVVGHVTPGGMLACLLADVPAVKPVSTLEGAASENIGRWVDG